MCFSFKERPPACARSKRNSSASPYGLREGERLDLDAVTASSMTPEMKESLLSDDRKRCSIFKATSTSRLTVMSFCGD